MNLNQSTRTFYDADEFRAHNINSESPLKYTTTNPPTRYFTHEVGVVDTRPALTRMNEVDYPSTELFGTAPYQLHGSPYAAKEATLIQGKHTTKTKFATEEHPFFERNVFHPNHVSANVPINTTGMSTRNVYRNVKF
tara:strand:- start:432 stop:842 length:411 start_codon:yes stop_codon:yes gene_type:complete